MIRGAESIEQKQSSPYVQEILSGGTYSAYDYYRLSPYMAFWLWERSDSVGNAVDRICWAFQQMNPVLIDKKTNEHITDHPFLELLNNPGPMQGDAPFLYQLMTSFLVAGECYPVAIGNPVSAPTALYTINSNHTSLVELNGWLDSIIMSANFDQNKYNRQEEKKRKIWIYRRENGLAETVQIYIQRQRSGLRALSPLQRIFYQAVTKFEGTRHNYGIVKNGSRPSGLWSPAGNDTMSQEQYEAFKTEVRSFTGPGNSGRNVVSPMPTKYENLILNTRDMDFIQLIEKSNIDVYNQYNIPLPLVLSNTMTQHNYQIATEALYDLAVLPPAKFLFKSLGKFLLPRYKDGDRYVLSINEKELPALKARLFRRVESMSKTYVFSDNEMRNEAGWESLGDDGNTIWKPSTYVPSGQDDDYTDDLIPVKEKEENEYE